MTSHCGQETGLRGESSIHIGTDTAFYQKLHIEGQQLVTINIRRGCSSTRTCGTTWLLERKQIMRRSLSRLTLHAPLKADLTIPLQSPYGVY